MINRKDPKEGVKGMIPKRDIENGKERRNPKTIIQGEDLKEESQGSIDKEDQMIQNGFEGMI